MDIETIETADASPCMICGAIYAQFKRKSGGFSCKLVFVWSKIVPKDMSMLRAELLPASLNAVSGHVVELSFGDMYKKCWKLTDSQVVLHWIGYTRSTVKMWVRNRVIEINRLADASLWRYVESRSMIAILGTRKGAKIADVEPRSDWIMGQSWMRGCADDFPIKTAKELILSTEEMHDAKKESIVIESCEVAAEQAVKTTVHDFEERCELIKVEKAIDVRRVDCLCIAR